MKHVPRNDKNEIKYLKKSYNEDPAKGLIHGLQKDAIQNSIGAAKNSSLNSWGVIFELLEIEGNTALSITDYGTTGLTGRILNDQEINSLAEKGELGIEENLSRFLSVYNSGGNVGPGSYGRGKLVFTACSSTYTFVCDSLTDTHYLAFERTIESGSLVQSEEIKTGESAKNFFHERLKYQIEPLEKVGTRVIILDLIDEPQKYDLTIEETFLNSFKNISDPNCELSFSRMIQESWWEILLKYDAQIWLKYGKKKKRVQLDEDLLKLFTISDNKEGWRVFEREKAPIILNDEECRIKKIRFLVAPDKALLPEEFCGNIFVQRKRMKIGDIGRRLSINAKIKNRFVGFIELEEKLEDQILEHENLTHYGFDSLRPSVIISIRQVLKSYLNEFQKELGLIKDEEDSILERDIREALKEVNEAAKDFGLVVNVGQGAKKWHANLKLIDFKLPNENSLRVEYNDTIGPIKLEIENTTRNILEDNLTISISQRGNSHRQIVLRNLIKVYPNQKEETNVHGFKLNTDFRYGEAVLIKIEFGGLSKNISKLLWLGREEPNEKDDYPLDILVNPLMFPRIDTKRVELGESIKNVGFVINNKTGYKFESRLNVLIRRGGRSDKEKITQILDQSSHVINPLSENSVEIGEVIIDESFRFLSDEAFDEDARKCELYIRIISEKDYPDFNIARGSILAPRKRIPFLFGIDDEGDSIFNDIKTVEDPNDPRKSWYEGYSTTGYTFTLNSAHPSYKKLKSYGDYQELTNQYYIEELLKQALAIGIENGAADGLFNQEGKEGVYHEIFTEVDSMLDGVIIFDEFLSFALARLYGE